MDMSTTTAAADLRKRKAAMQPLTPSEQRSYKFAREADGCACDTPGSTSDISSLLNCTPHIGETNSPASTGLSTCSTLEWPADEGIFEESPRYIRGTRLVVWGWMQACRGCNEITSREKSVGGRDIFLCPKCQTKHNCMASGAYPPNTPADALSIEPLCFWVPRLLSPMPPMSNSQRESFCDALLLKQDDAWQTLIEQS